MQDDRLSGSPGYALVRAFRLVNRATSRAVQSHDLSAEQAHILLELWLEGPMKVGDLQRILALSSGTLTGALDRMVKARLIKRSQDPEDKRVWRVEAAKIHPRARSAIISKLESTERKIFSVFTGGERRALLRLLTKLIESFGSG
jgi:DNA-binding MarR family transcriptional regulator